MHKDVSLRTWLSWLELNGIASVSILLLHVDVSSRLPFQTCNFNLPKGNVLEVVHCPLGWYHGRFRSLLLIWLNLFHVLYRFSLGWILIFCILLQRYFLMFGYSILFFDVWILIFLFSRWGCLLLQGRDLWETSRGCSKIRLRASVVLLKTIISCYGMPLYLGKLGK